LKRLPEDLDLRTTKYDEHPAAREHLGAIRVVDRLRVRIDEDLRRAADVGFRLGEGPVDCVPNICDWIAEDATADHRQHDRLAFQIERGEHNTKTDELRDTETRFYESGQVAEEELLAPSFSALHAVLQRRVFTLQGVDARLVSAASEQATD
jgi:hypothetical protein